LGVFLTVTARVGDRSDRVSYCSSPRHDESALNLSLNLSVFSVERSPACGEVLRERPIGRATLLVAMAFSARPYLQQQQQQQQQQRDGFGAFPKRVWSPRDVVSAARRDEARSSTADGLLHRRGRAPKPMVRTSLGAEARALLARMASDQPPGPSGFGSKVSIDGEHLLALFGGSKVPKWLEPTVEDTAHASIVSIVNQSDEAALKCLKSLMTEASKSMEQAESKAKLVEEKRTKASRETYDGSVASVHGGRKRRSLLVGERDDLR
jgi:hypothetical protein